MIQLQKLTFQRGEQRLFRQLSFEFGPGTFTLLTGDSGSGKSTLMRLIAGFAGLTYEGKILVADSELRQRSMSEKARQIGMMFQVPERQFTMGTLRKEIIFACENLGFDPHHINEALRQGPQKVKTKALLDRPLAQLSGGEKQKAVLTVLLAMDPQVLLLDEPFASVDPVSRQELLQVLNGLRDEGKTILLSDHDHDGYRQLVDEWVHLEGGQLQRRTPETLPLARETLPLSRSATAAAPEILQLQQVSYGRADGGCLLQASDFSFQKGITTLTGANGVGKSTLVRAIAQRYKYQGRMLFHKQRLWPRKKLYHQLSVAVQDAQKQFVTMTIQDELSYGVKQIPNAAAKQREALTQLGLADKESLFQLSEGQKKMVQLISMLSLDLELLILDEPFSGLDQQACAYFVSWLEERRQVQDFLIVTHRLEPLAGVSDHHVILREQRLSREVAG